MATITPSTCATPEAAREQIDRLDRKLIAILQERHLYGERIAELLGIRSNPDVMTPFLAFMKDRRAWGKQKGIESDYIDRVFAVIAQRYFDRRIDEAASRNRVFR